MIDYFIFSIETKRYSQRLYFTCTHGGLEQI